MLRLTLCLLLAKSAYAANAFPMEHLSYGPIRQDTNLVYNFEQIRRDQPPQIELREENINKYSGKPRTTAPVPERPIDNGDMSPMYPQPYNAMQWEALLKAPEDVGPYETWNNVPAPPSFPNWDSLLSDLAVTNPKNYESVVIPQQPIVVPSKKPAQWSESTFTVPAMQERVAPHMSWAKAPARGRAAQRLNWSDEDGEPSSAPASASTPATTRMPPPAAPTLSPWLDGF